MRDLGILVDAHIARQLSNIAKKPEIVDKGFPHFESKKFPEETHIGPGKG